MAIQLSKKQSDLEKRLKLLHNQVYGKSQFAVNSKQFSAKDKVYMNSSSDITYLRQDLLKIVTLSAGAIAIQIVLYFSLQNHVLNLKLF